MFNVIDQTFPVTATVLVLSGKSTMNFIRKSTITVDPANPGPAHDAFRDIPPEEREEALKKAHKLSSLIVKAAHRRDAYEDMCESLYHYLASAEGIRHGGYISALAVADAFPRFGNVFVVEYQNGANPWGFRITENRGPNPHIVAEDNVTDLICRI
jgi:hypothetical protein